MDQNYFNPKTTWKCCKPFKAKHWELSTRNPKNLQVNHCMREPIGYYGSQIEITRRWVITVIKVSCS